MKSKQDESFRFTSRALGYIACLSAALVGILGISDGHVDSELLSKISVLRPPMPPNVGLGLIFGALGVCLGFNIRGKRWSNIVIFLIGIGLTLFGAISIAESVLSLPRLSPQVGLNFILLGLAFLFCSQKIHFIYFSQFLGLAMAANAVVSLTGYIFGIRGFFTQFSLSPITGTPAQIALAFILLATGWILRYPNQGVMSLFILKSHSGAMARRFLFTLLLLPPALAIFTRLGSLLGIYGIEFQLPLFTFIFIGTLLYVSWRVSRQSQIEEVKASKLLNEVRQAHQDVSAVLENASDGIFISSYEGTYQQVNHVASQMLDYEPEEIVGKRYYDLIHPDEWEEIDRVKSKLMANGGSNIGEWRLQRKSGKYLSVEASTKFLTDGRWITMVRDISGRKALEQVENEMRQRADMLARISRELSESLDFEQTLEKAASVVVPSLADGSVIRLLGDSGQMEVVKVIHRDPDRKKLVEDFVYKMAQNGDYHQWLKTLVINHKPVIVTDRKAESYVELHGAQINYSKNVEDLGINSFAVMPLLIHGRFIGLMTFVTDQGDRHIEPRNLPFFEAVSQRISLSIENSRLYQKAKDAVKSREDILSIVSHDLRNPLMGIKVAAEMLRLSGGKDNTVTEGALRTIENSSEQMEKLINDLLDLGKLESGGFGLRVESANILDVVQANVDILKAQTLAKGQTLKLDIPEHMDLFNFDKKRIGQVVSNLLGNAIKFTQHGGTITLCVWPLGDTVKVQVADNGPGIAPERLQNIFGRFWQVEEDRDLGTGLGLYIVKKIIEAHGGELGVESAVGEGSTFYFTLPIRVSYSVESTASP